MRKILATAAMATLAIGAFAVPASAGAPVSGTGTSTCNITGAAKIKPALTGTDHGPAAISVKATLNSCTGTGDGATIGTGSAKGLSTTADSTCTGLAGGTTNLELVVKWKGGKKLLSSDVQYSTLAPDLTKATLEFTLGGTVHSGSFSGSSVSTHAVTPTALADFVTACAGKGVKGFTIASGTSSIS